MDTVTAAVTAAIHQGLTWDLLRLTVTKTLAMAAALAAADTVLAMAVADTAATEVVTAAAMAAALAAADTAAVVSRAQQALICVRYNNLGYTVASGNAHISPWIIVLVGVALGAVAMVVDTVAAMVVDTVLAVQRNKKLKYGMKVNRKTL